MFRRWARFHLRKFFKPIPVDYARKKKRDYASIYAFCAWNLVGLAFYYMIKENYPMTETEEKDTSRWFIRLFQLENVKLHRIVGFSIERVDTVEHPGDLYVDGKLVVKKNEMNPKIYEKFD